MENRRSIIHIVAIIIVEALVISLFPLILPGLLIESFLSAVFLGIVLVFAQAFFWWLFIRFFAWLPAWLYPIITFILVGLVVTIAGNFVPGVEIEGIRTGIWITLIMTATNAILGGLLSLNIDEQFDRNVTQQLVKRRGKPVESDIPGFIFLEIDGLSESIFRRALDDGYMPHLKRWLDQGTHTIQGWETEFTAQTGAMQTGILMGNNDNIPAYRWWSRQEGRIVMSSDPRDAKRIEAHLSSGRGLLSDGGASRGNMYSGDASESMLTFSTLLDRSRGRGPGFYFYLMNPFVIARLITRYLNEVLLEIWQAWKQRRRKDKFIVNARTPFYAFFRAFMGSFLQDMITYTVISDLLRGVPAIYALYAGYDDLGHFAGMQTPEAFKSLEETDHYFGRIERALDMAPRPYHIVVLSDHGQSEGFTFNNAYGVSLDELVQGLVKGDHAIYAALNTNESWDNINAFLNESIHADTRTAGVLRTMMRSKTNHEDMVAVGPGRDVEEITQEESKAKEAKIVVMASGCTGLINFTDAGQRMSYEEIQKRHPDLILGLVSHPGVGFVMVKSEKDGTMVLGEEGINFLDQGQVEGQDPLEHFSPHAPDHLRRETSFENCPDLIVNAAYDPETEEICGFENQVSHHGGLGGKQNFPFIFHPTELTVEEKPIIGATSVYRLLRGWRDMVQGLEKS